MCKLIYSKNIFLCIGLTLFTVLPSNMYANTGNNIKNEVHFNFYSRNVDGSFVLENIPVDTFSVSLFSYTAQYEGTQLKQIVGYYYQTNTVKFIDEIINNHIIKSMYLDYESGEPFYIRELKYNNQNLLISEFVKFIDDRYKNYEIKVVVEPLYDSKQLKYTEISTQEIRDDIIQDYINRGYPVQRGNLYSKINGTLTKDFHPIQLQAETKLELGDQYLTAIFDEKYEYSDNKMLSKYTVSLNNKLLASMDVISNNMTYIERAQNFDMQGNAYNIRRSEQTGDIYIVITEKDLYNGITDPKVSNKMQRIKYTNDLFLEYYYYGDNFLEKEDQFVLVGNDERIIFDLDLTVAKSSIAFSLSVLTERIHSYGSVQRMYSTK
ncbi:MAG: hypothetical protein Ta2B_00520 [Termitinemataceae bacterium]|nr:MAG: hypothetical protein Ta2B_00520 [Termitinemataceae bacterium]